MEELIQLITKTYGIVGLIMMSPFIGLVYVWRHSHKVQEDADKKNTELQLKINEVNEKRVSDFKEVSERLIKVISSSTSTSNETNLLLERLGDYLSSAMQSKKGE